MAINIWPNADLEAGIDDWNLIGGGFPSIAWSTTQSWSTDGGTHSLAISPNGTYKGAVSDVLPVSPNTQYTASWYVWVTDADETMDFKIYDQDENTIKQETNQTHAANEWFRVDLTGTTGADDTGIKLLCRSSGTHQEDAVIYLDAVMLETGASASAWTNYVASEANVFPEALAMSLAIHNPIVSVSLPWDIGPFIYGSAATGVSVNPPLLQMSTQIHDPVVYAVDVPTAVAPPLLQTNIQMFNPTVNVGTFRNRIASMLHLIMGR